jgi:hypothetical protein
MEFTRVNNDVNGNPRVVVHFFELLTNEESRNYDLSLGDKYDLALNRAKKLGGRKFSNKQFGGGIVFQSYNNDFLAQKIKESLN